MFKQIFLFELTYRLKRPATYLYWGILFLITYLLFIILAGTFPGVYVSLGGSGGNVMFNSPYTIHTLSMVIAFLGILIMSAIMGNPVYRDYEHDTHGLFYSYPISKFGYLGGRFLGSFVITCLVFTGIPFGYMFGALMPWIDQTKMLPFNFLAYAYPYLVSMVPNIMFIGLLFFVLATTTRKILSVYVGSVILMILFGVTENFIDNMDSTFWASLLDPTGNAAVTKQTEYWTPAEKNALLVPFTAGFFFNRVLWIGVGIASFFYLFNRFNFSFLGRQKKRRKIMPQADEVHAKSKFNELVIPDVSRLFNLKAAWLNFLRLVKFEFRDIVLNIYFIAIVFTGVVFMAVNGSQLDEMYGTVTFPVTYQVLDLLTALFSIFTFIILTYYAGELVWREREAKINEIADSMPISNNVMTISKLGALVLVQAVLMLVIMLTGIVMQTFHGYFNYEIDVYIKSLFGIRFIDLTLLSVLAILIHIIVNHKYLGHIIMIAYFVGSLFILPQLVENNLYIYASDPGIRYSAMNGFGHFVWPFIVFKLYWGAFAVFLAMASNVFFIRGRETNFKTRFKVSMAYFKTKGKVPVLASLVFFLLFAGYIFYNTNILNEFIKSKKQQELQANYEKKYKKYQYYPQPRRMAVKLNVDIFPENRDAVFEGEYRIKNITNKPIDTVLVNVSNETEVEKFIFEKEAKLVLNDKLLGFNIYKLSKSMMPGDEMKVIFKINYLNKGFENEETNTDILYNGTFINSSALPFFGYYPNVELTDKDERKEYGLPDRPRMANINDTLAVKNNYINIDADWVEYEATLSTSPDQIAITAGELVKEWEENERRYFKYKSKEKILCFFPYLSANYTIKKDKWHDVDLAVYYQKGHEFNIDRMMDGMKAALEFCSDNFSPFQFSQLRIFEFPRFASFAQSFANTIPFSESIGFIANVQDDNNDVDYPFLVAAHETGHQWWAHQVIGGNVQGATVMSEVLAQYTALMTVLKKYGRERANKYLRYEMRRYLTGRSFERRAEQPLLYNENQAYLHYRKGTVVMNSLLNYIGEDSLNTAIRRYTKDVAFKGPPYTTSEDFIKYIYNVTPDSLQYLVKDLFEKITLYDNKAVKAEATKQTDGKYLVNLEVESAKVYSDSIGNETDAKLNDWIEVALMKKGKDENDNEIKTPLYKKFYKINKGKNNIEILVDEKPDLAGIDPFYLLIDKHTNDNTVDIEFEDTAE